VRQDWNIATESAEVTCSTDSSRHEQWRPEKLGHRW